jgi:predicted RNA-binding Zn ribbon-like protein
VSTAIRPGPELEAVLGFLNTYDELEDPKDRLTSVAVLRDVLGRRGLDELATGLTDRHLGALRRLRENLREVFLEPDETAKAEVLNRLLDGAGARARLRRSEDGWAWTASSTRTGLAPLTAVLAGALADVLAAGASERLGVCAGHPCRCVYVDTTRSKRQRYCCELCNDRMAAAAYRRRRERR